MKHTPGILCKYTIYITINPSYYSYECRNRNVTAHIRDMPLSHVDYYAHNALPFLATFFFNCSHLIFCIRMREIDKKERERESMWPFRWKYLISSFTCIFFRIFISLSLFIFLCYAEHAMHICIPILYADFQMHKQFFLP